MKHQNPGLRLIAHRGWPTRFPENSLAGFMAAIAVGAQEVELDTWASRDGIPFVCHDPTLERTTTLCGRHDTIEFVQIRTATVRHPDGNLLPGMGLPSLRQALDLCTPRVAVNIHVKDTGPDNCILFALRDYFGPGVPRCGSYLAGNRQVLEAAIEICPEIPRCCLEGSQDGDRLLAQALDLGCTRLQFRRGCFSEATLARALENGLITNMFWSDDAGEIASLYADGILAPLTNDIGPVCSGLVAQGLMTWQE